MASTRMRRYLVEKRLDRLQAMADLRAAIDHLHRHPPAAHDSSLFDRSPHTASHTIGRVRQQLSLESPLFRHAVRLSLALGAGYAAMRVQEG